MNHAMFIDLLGRSRHHAMPDPGDAGPAPQAVPRVTDRHRRRAALLRRLASADFASALAATVIGLGTLRLQPSFVSALGLPLVWILALVIVKGYDLDVLSDGVSELLHVLAAAGLVLAGLALFSWGWNAEVPRDPVTLTLPLTVGSTLLGRWTRRRLLRRTRRSGRHTENLLLVGHRAAVSALSDRLQQRADLAYHVIGCCLPPTAGPGRNRAEVPVLGGLTDVPEVVRRYGVDSVAVLPSAGLEGVALSRLGWDLERIGANLLMAPGLIETTRGRTRLRCVSGIPLLHVAGPELRGRRPLTKFVFDLSVASLLLGILAPFLVAITVAVAGSGSRRILVSQPRSGRYGRTFPLLRFCTTAPDGHVTRVGTVLRRYSLEHLPQLFNVLKGDMSLVGPRPPLAGEVGVTDGGWLPRFLVKPGLTGLSLLGARPEQLGGHPVDVHIRCDVHTQYVENWSLRLDMSILVRTGAAAIRRQTAG